MADESGLAPDGPKPPEVDPEDFLRALLKISPEDAAKAREAAAKREREQQAPRAGGDELE